MEQTCIRVVVLTHKLGEPPYIMMLTFQHVTKRENSDDVVVVVHACVPFRRHQQATMHVVSELL